MEKRKIFEILLTILFSAIALVVVIKLVFKSDSINEGRFRISDVILTSTAELEDKTKQNNIWSLNISQKNVLSMLINTASESNIERIYISDAKVTNNKQIAFYVLNNENRIELNKKKQELEVDWTLNEDNTIKLELVALNENILKNWEVPETTKEIICDGRIFESAGLTLSDLEFEMSFKLNIIEKNGKTNTVKVRLDLPSEELVLNGADIRRLNRNDFKFRVK